MLVFTVRKRIFFNICLQEKNGKRLFMIIASHDDCFKACCKDFLKATIKNLGLNKIKSLLLSDSFYSSGLILKLKAMCFHVYKGILIKKNIDNCCFCRQIIILKSLSKELHHVINMS